jgi:SAM-dependent methyltransferase
VRGYQPECKDPAARVHAPIVEGGPVDGIDAVRRAVQRLDEAVWELAALVLVLDTPGDAVGAAAQEVLAARQLAGSAADVDGPLRAMIAAQARSPLLQAAALVSGGVVDWSHQPDEALLAQGRASGQAAAPFATYLLPQLGSLGERLRQPGARMLDVGTGVGALALAYAEQFPALQVVGIDVLPRVLALAEQTLASSPAGERVELRRQSVAELADREAFDLAWVPAPFVPPVALRAGLPRVVAALRPGGWAMLGHGKLHEDPVKAALTRFKTVAYGGTPLDDEQAQRELADAGCDHVQTVPTPPGAPSMTVGQRPLS